jgi:hypothetical protein
MSQYLEAFILGNQAILTNVCLLPLYPGLIAFLAGNATNERTGTATRWLGLLVLAGVLSMMLLIGFLLYAFSRSFGDVLPVLLPLVYGAVIVFGLLMLAGYNPFARLTAVQAPAFSNPYVTAYMYGLLLGPMTLPCTGPAADQRLPAGGGQFRGAQRGVAVLPGLRAGLWLGASGPAVPGHVASAALHGLADQSLQAADARLWRAAAGHRAVRPVRVFHGVRAQCLNRHHRTSSGRRCCA